MERSTIEIVNFPNMVDLSSSFFVYVETRG